MLGNKMYSHNIRWHKLRELVTICVYYDLSNLTAVRTPTLYRTWSVCACAQKMLHLKRKRRGEGLSHFRVLITSWNILWKRSVISMKNALNSVVLGGEITFETQYKNTVGYKVSMNCVCNSKRICLFSRRLYVGVSPNLTCTFSHKKHAMNPSEEG